VDVTEAGRRAAPAAGAGAVALVLAALAGCGASPAAESAVLTASPAAGVGGGFTDPQRWPSLPALTGGSLLTLDEVTAALPEAAPFGMANVSWVRPPWQFPWCDDGDGPFRTLTAAPPPRDQQDTVWAGQGYPSTTGATGAFVTVHAVRWEPVGEDGVASARQWSAALRDDAAGCPGAVVLDAAGLPGEEPLLTATLQASGSWKVQAVTTGGPTGLRFDVGVTAATAEEAGAVVAPLVVTAVGRLASADDLAGHLRDHPGDRPALTAEHLMTDTQFDGGTAADPPAALGPLLPERVAAGWCERAPALDVAPPEQAWGTTWAKPAAEGVDVLAVDERLLRFTGLGDEEGLAAAEGYSRALRDSAGACPGAAAVELDGDGVLPEWHGTDVMVAGVDEGDGTWTTTVTARDGVTVLVLRMRGTAPMGWSTGLALGLLENAWSRVRHADRAPGATASLSASGAVAGAGAER
jgi:hypothetical protein